MAFKTEPYSGPVDAPKYDYQRYPLNLHRGTYPNHQSKAVYSPEEEQAALAAGWSTQAPQLPPPEIEFVAAKSLEERVNWLQAEVERLSDQGDELKERLASLMEMKRRTLRPKAEPAETTAEVKTQEATS